MSKGSVPQVLLLTGPSGVGKTTIARIVRNFLKCGKQDFTEINCANANGIDMVRGINRVMGMNPMSGKCRIYLLDESQNLTGDAQKALLKLCEDTPSHVYFMLATTDPQKLIKAIHTRASEVKLGPIPQGDVVKLCKSVLVAEGVSGVSEEVLEAIAEASEGSGRKALVILEQVAGIEGEKDQLAAISTTSMNKEAGINLARALFNPRVQWSEVAAILKELKEEPESLRHMILAYSTSVLLGGGPLSNRAFMMIDCFARNFYDSKRAGLVAACYEAVTKK